MIDAIVFIAFFCALIGAGLGMFLIWLTYKAMTHD